MTDAAPHDHPFHREEAVRIGRVVHATMSYGCASARVIGHPNGKPDDEKGAAYLALDTPPGMSIPALGSWTVWRMWRSDDPKERPAVDTWHWPRACPFGV